jgi:hypothetical protein
MVLLLGKKILTLLPSEIPPFSIAKPVFSVRTSLRPDAGQAEPVPRASPALDLAQGPAGGGGAS